MTRKPRRARALSAESQRRRAAEPIRVLAELTGFGVESSRQELMNRQGYRGSRVVPVTLVREEFQRARHPLQSWLYRTPG